MRFLLVNTLLNLLLAFWDRNKYQNFYSTSKIQTTQNGPCEAGILGYSPYPGGGASTDAVICLASSMDPIATPNTAGGVYGISMRL